MLCVLSYGGLSFGECGDAVELGCVSGKISADILGHYGAGSSWGKRQPFFIILQQCMVIQNSFKHNFTTSPT